MYMFAIILCTHFEGKPVPPYKKMYLQLFNAITDALALLEAGDADSAAQILASAQQRGEDLYISREKISNVSTRN